MSTHRITDIEMRRFPQRVMFSPGLRTLLQVEADYVAALYRAKVAKETGKLAASTHAYVTVGGHKHDRLVGKVTVGTGVEYGVLHEFGAKSNPARKAAKDLAEVMATRTRTR